MIDEKLLKSARIIDRLLKILQGFAIAAAIVSAVFIPLTLIFGEKLIADADNPTFGCLVLQLTDSSYVNTDGFGSLLVPMLILCLVMCVIAWYGLHVLRGIFVPLKEGRPFEHGISGKIRRMGWIALLGGAVLEIGSAVIEGLECRLYDLSALFNPDVVTGYSFDYEIDGTFAILAILLFILSYVFRYGEALQQESDETL